MTENKPIKIVPVGKYTGELEPRKSRKSKYDYEELKKTLLNGDRYILPVDVKSVTTAFKIRKKLINDEPDMLKDCWISKAKNTTQYVFIPDKE